MSLQSKAQASHLGRDKCYSTLQQHYSFPMMRDRIQMYIKYCNLCQKQNTHKIEKCAHALKPIFIPQKCFSKVRLDLIWPLCESNQKKYIISCVDYFSKRLGYKINGVNREKWHSDGYEVCFAGIWEKFMQNQPLLQLLKSTIPKTIAEATTDKIWGTGITLWDTSTLQTDKWHSPGWLSRMLMTIRDEH